MLLACFVVKDTVEVVLHLAAASIFADAIDLQRSVINESSYGSLPKSFLKKSYFSPMLSSF